MPTDKSISDRIRVQFDQEIEFEELKEESTCSICWDAIQAKDSTKIDCCHTFHLECIMRWIEVPNRTCPNCRAQVFSMQCGPRKASVLPENFREPIWWRFDPFHDYNFEFITRLLEDDE
ncbi:hypothetical protein PRIPAC_94556 [Pristionchus pacificus]|uniref:Zinc finger protein n=1 Tax=Pristionchus pacificus TaxID=54126 RepID=A0A2A6CDL8_PRIPA|nr:hypothetical protein PRIPAC_94556 [Pristionchus pacificus]|eukprot:PDM76133.1 zinc finger protein [Pristionchus pacificus]